MTRTIEEFSRDVYQVDVLKVEFPVIARYVEGSAVYCGTPAYGMQEALEHFQAADEAADLPYIYLSAGVSSLAFRESLRLAISANARFSGVLCGRANWQDGVSAYASADDAFDRAGLTQWLENTGIANIRAINELLKGSTPWHGWFR